MKKILFLSTMLALVLCTTQVTAQKKFIGSSSGAVLDTLVTSATIYLTSPSLVQEASGEYVIQFDATNLTGTTTATAVLQSSMDGVTYANHFKTPGQTGVNCDTLAVSGTTQHIWNVRKGANTYYAGTAATYPSNSGRRIYFRIKLVAGATGTTKVKAWEYPQ